MGWQTKTLRPPPRHSLSRECEADVVELSFNRSPCATASAMLPFVQACRRRKTQQRGTDELDGRVMRVFETWSWFACGPFQALLWSELSLGKDDFAQVHHRSLSETKAATDVDVGAISN